MSTIPRPKLTRTGLVRPVALGATLLLVSACADGFQMPNFQNPFGDRERAEIDRAAQPTQVRPDPDARGVITYNTYQVIVARGDDTIPTMAQRVGLAPVELAAHNGLPLTYRPREGEVLALPRDVGGSPSDNQWSPDVISDAIDSAPLTSSATAPVGETPFQNGQPFPVIDPIRHRVEPGDTAYSIARLYGVSVTALASWNGLGSDLAVRENQELLIPVVNSANSVGQPSGTQVAALEQQGAAAGAAGLTAAAGATATDALPPARPSVSAPGQGSSLPTPPSAAEPLPENQDVAAVEVPPGPDLGALRTPPGGRLVRPVEGSILRPFAPNASSGRNEGVDIAAAAGTPVKAAGDGEVALVSESLGGLGTILLIRHADDLMTVYGRIDGVSLKKGDRVSTGQTVGTVAPGDPANLHFEVRRGRGTEPVDPMPYLGG